MNTLFDKIWDAHVVQKVEDGPTQLYIDRLYCHEVTSPQAFSGLRERGIKCFRPEKIFCMPDHNTPTHDQDKPIEDPVSKTQVDTLAKNAEEFGLAHFGMMDKKNGIIHVVGPERGLTLPGMTIVCGDSHTSTHGAMGAVAFGIGTSEVEMVMASQCILQTRPKTMRITVDGKLNDNGWKADGWKEANLNNSTWQTDPAEGITADISYKYQFRADDDKFYVAVIFDGESIDVAEGIEDGNGNGTFVRVWMQSKTAEGYADAVSYTHFYDIYRQGEGTVLHAWKNTFINEKGNKKEAIANTTGSAASSVKDGKTYYEFSIDLDEFTKGDFQMFLNIGSLFGEGDSTTYLITLHPAVDAPIKDDGKKDLTNFPYNIWNTEKALDVKLADIKLDNGEPKPPVDDDPDKKYIEEIIASVGEKNPDGQFDLVIEAPEEYKAGDEITVNVKIKNIKVEEGIVSLLADFYYDNEKLTLLNTADEDGAIECITLPDSWENLVKQDKDEQHNVIDNGHITLAVLTGNKKPVKDDDSLTFTFKFKVKEDAKNAIGFYIPHESVTAKKYDLTDVLGNGGYAITKMHVEGEASSSSSKTTQTGDGSTSMIVFAIVALVAICGSAVVIKSRK